MTKPFVDVCRICLSTAVDKDLCDLKVGKNESKKSYTEVIAFCLDIQVTNETKLRKLCSKCYNKIVSFYKFKTLALKNHALFKSYNPDCTVKLEVFVREQSEDVDPPHGTIDTYYNETKINEDFHLMSDIATNIKEEPDIKTENDLHQYQSDDELLADIRDTKYNQNNKADVQKVSCVKKARRRKKGNLGSKTRQMCPECGKEVWDLRLHSIKHLPLEEKRRHKCLDCDKTFSSYQSMRKHYRTKHLGMRKHCDVCNKDVVSLRAHNLQVHEKDSLPFACMFCNRRFLSRSYLEDHVLLHTDERPHSCDVCHKRFRLKSLMLNHKRSVHEGEKSNLCQFCPKRFFKKQHLDIHLRSHTQERPYQCLECNKFFSSSSTLKNHQVLHTGERKYKCHLCDSSFSQSGNLAKHIVIHTRERKFKCKYCDIRFGRQDHRKRHEYTAHEKHVIALNLTTT